jgi:hypothetical protein
MVLNGYKLERIIRFEGPHEKKLLANKEMNLLKNVEKFVEI